MTVWSPGSRSIRPTELELFVPHLTFLLRRHPSPHPALLNTCFWTALFSSIFFTSVVCDTIHSLNYCTHRPYCQFLHLSHQVGWCWFGLQLLARSQRFAANPPRKSKVSRAIFTNSNALGRDHEYDTGRLIVALDILPVCFLSRDLLTRAAERLSLIHI